jgi:aspartate aminotransferase-like enzyme
VELDYFIQRLQKEGNEKRVQAIQKKRQYLESYIQSMQLEVGHLKEHAA